MSPANDAMVGTAAVTSYAGATASVVAGLTLTDWGIIAGIVTAFLTFALNMWFQRRRDRREQQLHELQLANLKGQGQ